MFKLIALISFLLGQMYNLISVYKSLACIILDYTTWLFWTFRLSGQLWHSINLDQKWPWFVKMDDYVIKLDIERSNPKYYLECR
jgi:hypothetical protein